MKKNSYTENKTKIGNGGTRVKRDQQSALSCQRLVAGRGAVTTRIRSSKKPVCPRVNLNRMHTANVVGEAFVAQSSSTVELSDNNVGDGR
jgi:hypothetical protein